MVLRDLEPFLLATFHSPFLFPDFTTLHIWGLPRELLESQLNKCGHFETMTPLILSVELVLIAGATPYTPG